MPGEQITARLGELIETLNLLPPGEERLLQLIALGKKYPPLSEELRTPQHLLPGCVSQLWIVAQQANDGTLSFVMDADAAISKGIAAAVCGLYNGEKPADILAVEPNFFDVTGLTGLISPNRSNALSNLRKFIVRAARESDSTTRLLPTTSTTTDGLDTSTNVAGDTTALGASPAVDVVDVVASSRVVAAPRRAVFWDRDGTLMHEAAYCSDPANVQSIPGAAKALAALRAAGWLNIIITNQSGIGRGYYTTADYEAVNRELFKQLAFTPDAVYHSPEAPEAASPRRKPGIGMLEEARDQFGIDLSQSWMVGDKPIDIAAGRAAGCCSILVLTGYGKTAADCHPDYTIADASQVARIILG